MPHSGPETLYRARAFAELAGVTIRTLHHYDRLGLLRAKRSSRGYRLYRGQDLERLEQITALKSLGLPLANIRRILEGESGSLLAELGRQRSAIREKQRLLDVALSAIGDAEAAIQDGKPNHVLLRRLIQTITMQNDTDWMMRYYSPAARAKIAEKAASFTPAMQAEISQAWKEYFSDVKALSLEEDRDGEKAAELAKRYKELLAAFTGEDPEIEAGLHALYKDRQSWPDDMKERIGEYENPTR